VENFLPTLRADLSSILASLVSGASIPTLTGPFHYFLNRSPKAYNFIISYLRNNCCLDLISLPQDVPSLQELLCGCAFLELDDLTKRIEQSINGKVPFQLYGKINERVICLLNLINGFLKFVV
jgi:hypothetical protein